jgi:hypothetical protein
MRIPEIENLKNLLDSIPRSFQRCSEIIVAETNSEQCLDMWKALLRDQNEFTEILEKIRNVMQEAKITASDDSRHVAA